MLMQPMERIASMQTTDVNVSKMRINSHLSKISIDFNSITLDFIFNVQFIDACTFNEIACKLTPSNCIFIGALNLIDWKWNKKHTLVMYIKALQCVCYVRFDRSVQIVNGNLQVFFFPQACGKGSGEACFLADTTTACQNVIWGSFILSLWFT